MAPDETEALEPVATIGATALGLAPGEDAILNRMLHTVLHTRDDQQHRAPTAR